MRWLIGLFLCVVYLPGSGANAQDAEPSAADDVARQAVEYQNQFELEKFEALMEESRSLLKDAAEAGSDNPDVYQALYLDSIQSRDDESMEWILKLYELEPSNASNALLAAEALFARARPDEGIELLKAHQDEYGNLATVGPMLATLQFVVQDLEGAKSTLDTVFENLDPDSPMLLVIRPMLESLRAKIHLYQGESARARDLLEALHEMAPEDGSIEMELGRAWLALDEPEIALEHLNDLLLPAPQNFMGEYYRGLALERLGRMEEAESAYQKADELSRRVEDQLDSEGEALLVLAAIARKGGQAERADRLKARAAEVGFTQLPPELHPAGEY